MNKIIGLKQHTFSELTGEEIKLLGIMSSLEKLEETTKKQIAEITKQTYRAVDYKITSLTKKGFIRKKGNGFEILRGVQ